MLNVYINLENKNISLVVSFWKECFFKNKLFRNHQNLDMDLKKLITPDEVSKFDDISERSTGEKWNPPKIHISGDLEFFREKCFLEISLFSALSGKVPSNLNWTINLDFLTLMWTHFDLPPPPKEKRVLLDEIHNTVWK